MITVVEALQQANHNANIKEFSFARIDEFQNFMDSFKFQQYPINIVLPFPSNGTTNRSIGIRKAVIPLNGWIMTRYKEDPVNARTAKAEVDYITPMRILAAKFIKNLLSTEIIDTQVLTITDTIKPEYMFLNAQTVGVSYTINLPIIANVC